MVEALVYIVLLSQVSDTSSYEMSEVVVTASRLSLPASLSPWPLEVLETDRPGDLAAALERSVSADVRSYGGEGQPTYFILSGVIGNRVLVLSGGVPLNSRTNGVVDLGMLALASGDRVEIVRGPLSALYGSAAIGGVVNVIPSYDEGLEAALRLDHFTGLQARVSASESFGPVAFRLSGSYLTFPGFRSNDDTERYNAELGFELGLGDAFLVEASGSYASREIGVAGPQPDTTFGLPRFGDELSTSLYDREEDRLSTAGIKTSFKPGDAFSAWLNLYGLAQRIVFDSRYLGFKPDYSEFVALERDEYYDTKLGADLFLSGEIGFLTLAGGVNVEREGVEVLSLVQDSATLDTTTDISWNANDLHVGAWTEEILDFGFLVPTVAARFDYSPQYGVFFSPEAGLSTTFAQRTKLSCAYGRAFRAPTFNDLYWPQGGDSTLKPEKGQTATLALDAQPFDFLRLNLSGSWKDISDMISWLPDSTGFWKATNVDRVVILGGEAKVQFALPDSLIRASLAGAYNHARERRRIVTYSDWLTGETRTDTVTRQAAFIPGLIFKGDVQLRLWKGGSIEYSATWTGRRVNYYADYSLAPRVTYNVKSINPSLKMDLALAQKFLKIVTCEVGARNLLNDRTPQQFGTSFQDLNYPAQPRTFYAAVSVRY